MKKHNQKGFGLVPVLLIVVIVAIVAYAGWYVWDSNHGANMAEEEIVTPTPTPSSISTNWSKFSNTYYAFLHPNNWMQISSTEPTSVDFRSSDYGEKDVRTERGSYKEINSGYSLQIIQMASDAPYETLDKLIAHIVDEEKTNASAGFAGGTHKNITVNGYQALWVNNKFSDTYLFVIVFANNKRVHIQLNTKDDSSSEAAILFENLLASFEIK
jgi:hypothetical protein